MLRLFVAIRPPAPVRARLTALMHGIAGARWQSDEQLHLTLLFIGEVDAPRADDLAAALLRIRKRRFMLALAGIGTFERRGRPHGLWAGLAPSADLSDLHTAVAAVARQSSVAGEARAFKPHITLARLNRDVGPIDGFAAANAGLTSDAFAIEAFGLYESVPAAEGSQYHQLARYPLHD